MKFGLKPEKSRDLAREIVCCRGCTLTKLCAMHATQVEYYSEREVTSGRHTKGPNKGAEGSPR